MALLTNTNQIQSLLEDLMHKEEVRSADLKKKFDNLSVQMQEKHLEIPSSQSEVVFGDSMTLKCNTQKSKQIVISAKSTIEDFIGNVKIGYGSQCPHSSKIGVGYRDDAGRIIYLRNNIDIQQYLARWYFAQEPPFVPVQLLTDKDLEPFKKFDFRKEVLTKDNNAVFRCEVAGPNEALVFIAVPMNLNLDEGKKRLETIFGKIQTMMFLDEAEDLITVDSTESWEYCIETGVAMSKNGKYPLLILQTT